MKRKIIIISMVILAVFLPSAGVAAAETITTLNSKVNTIQKVTTPTVTDSANTIQKVDTGQINMQNNAKQLQLQNNNQAPASTTTPFSAQASSATTHVGQPLHNLVLLCKNERLLPNNYYGFLQILPDGTPPWASVLTSYDFYSIPEGYTLIVTDVDWRAENGAPGKTAALQLHIAPSDLSYIGNCVFESTATLDSSGCGGASVSMTTGFAVSSGARLIATSYPSNNYMKEILVRGYLVPSN